MLPWLNLEQGDDNSRFEVFWMTSIDNIDTYWRNVQHCTRQCELLPVNKMLTVDTYSVLFTVVFTLHWMYLQVRAVRVQFFLRILDVMDSMVVALMENISSRHRSLVIAWVVDERTGQWPRSVVV